jgi:hypothetical protein
MKSKGRPKGPEKVVLKMRVPKGSEDKCRTAVYLALGGCVAEGVSGDRPEAQMASNAKQRSYEAQLGPWAGGIDKIDSSLKVARADMNRLMNGNPYPDKKPSEPFALPVTQQAAAKQNSEMSGQIKALLDDVEKLTKEKVYWEERFNKAAAATDGQWGSYWRARAVKAEARVAELENQ